MKELLLFMLGIFFFLLLLFLIIMVSITIATAIMTIINHGKGE